MAYKIRAILDVNEDVIRDLIVNESINLEELHFTITKSFGFKGQEMASFYQTNNEWEQGEEIPLFNMSEDENAISMQNCALSSVLTTKGDKLIYVYDFFSMWTFYIELIKITSTDKNLPYIDLSIGNVPDEAPKKEFTAEDSNNNFDIFNDEDDFENIDDFDFDNY